MRTQLKKWEHHITHNKVIIIINKSIKNFEDLIQK